MNNEPHVTIIILNWNGWQDTIECLESVLKLDYKYFNVILIDNHSSDDSILQIRQWASGIYKSSFNSRYSDLTQPEEKKPIRFLEYFWDDKINTRFSNKAVILIKNSENKGFALANNQGMRLAYELFQSKYYYLLNNDTVIEKDALKNVVDILEKDDTVSAAQSTILNYESGEIENAGGKIYFWGQTKYNYNISRNDLIEISFLSGCALFIRSEIILLHGYLSDKFFHGEEDFELSMRFKKRGLKMICSGGSRVYHKVGSSVKKLMQDYDRRVTLFAINRAVDLKYFYPRIVWYIWRIPAMLYFFYLFWLRYNVKFKRTFFLISHIYKYSSQISEVRKSTIERILAEMDLA